MAVAEGLKICEHFESILKGTFGPSGLDVMLQSSSGNILITNSGSMILSSLAVDHPVGKMLVDKVVSLNGSTGGGATYFILVLTQALREIVKNVTRKGSLSLRETSPEARFSLVALSHAFCKFECELFHVIVMPVLHKLAVRFDITKEEPDVIKEQLMNVIKTGLNGRFPSRIQLLFTNLLVDFLLNSCASFENMFQMIVDTIDGFPQLCIECSGVPLDMSHVAEGIMIPRQFATRTSEVILQEDQTQFKFLVLKFSLEESTLMTNATIDITSTSVLDRALNWKRGNIHGILHILKLQEIQLIISSEAISDMTLHLCNQLGIAVISMVPTEVVNHVCKYAGILSLPDLDLEQERIPETFLGRGKFCSTKILGSLKLVHLGLDNNTRNLSHLNACQIVLCAPTQGLCRQYYIALQGAVKSVRMSFGNNKHELCLLPGCGLVEIALSLELSSFSKKTEDADMSLVCSIFSKALLHIPRTLYSNSHLLSSEGTNFVKLQQEIEFGWKNGSPLVGVGGKTGQATNPYDEGIVEPFLGKQFLLCHLLQSLSQILRVDQIIRVKQIPKEQNSTTNAESSDSD